MWGRSDAAHEARRAKRPPGLFDQDWLLLFSAAICCVT